MKQGLREKILFAVDGQYLKGMKEPLVGYANRSPRELLTHLFDNCIQGAIDINVLEEALNDEWETDDHITEFYWKMDEKRAKVERAGVVISDSQICLKVVKQMYRSGHFDEVTMTEWERRAPADETLAHAKPFFLAKYKDKMMYRKATARQMGYAGNASANQVSEIFKSTLTKMADTVESDREAINQLVTNNNETMKATMETMVATMKKELTDAIQEVKKGKTTTDSTPTSRENGSTCCELCEKPKHRGGVLMCWELEQNKSMRPSDWESVLDKKIAKRKEQLSKAKKGKKDT